MNGCKYLHVQNFKPISSDCSDAINLSFDKNTIYGPTIPPNGFGNELEISTSDLKSVYAFETEHNSAWYVFETKRDGELTFDIVPQKSNDDYDFLLYKVDSGDFCRKIKNNEVKPIRSNISRVDTLVSGRTGLSIDAKAELIHAGPGNSFSKPIPVKRGEKYYLVLDNVYQNGLGHTVSIGYQKIISLSGVVLDDKNKPLKADVTIEDDHGNEIKKVKSDTKTGFFNFLCGVMIGRDYTLNTINDSCFVSTTELKSATIENGKGEFENIRTVLPRLKKGSHYKLGSINFEMGSPVLLQSSLSSVKALYKLMKKNSKMVIVIEGHVNHTFAGGEDCKDYQHQWLSDERAQTT